MYNYLIIKQYLEIEFSDYLEKEIYCCRFPLDKC